jgi:hypothetical protein
MARTKAEAVVIEGTVASNEVASEIQQGASQLAERSQQVMEQFGEGLPYELSRIVHETRFFMSQSAEAMLEAGKRLVILKEHEPHGDFVQIVEAQLGMAARTARVMMQAAIKYCSPKLDSKRQALAVLGKTKMFELMVEDDEQLAELADGGTIQGLHLDDIERMSSRELRKALRESRESHEDSQRIIADKNKKIDDQSKQISKIKRQPPDEGIQQIRTEIAAMQSSIEAEIRVNFCNGISALKETGGDDHQEFINAQLQLLDDALQFLRMNFGGAGVEWEQ